MPPFAHAKKERKGERFPHLVWFLVFVFGSALPVGRITFRSHPEAPAFSAGPKDFNLKGRQGFDHDKNRRLAIKRTHRVNVGNSGRQTTEGHTNTAVSQNGTILFTGGLYFH
jgi:hypothetical protein